MSAGTDGTWSRLREHARRLGPVHLRQLLRDQRRTPALAASLDDLTLDFSREKLDAAALEDLVRLARDVDVEGMRERMVAAEPINSSERRAVLHMALRGGAPAPAGADVAAERDRFLDFAEQVRAGPFRDVLNLGIGGSHLGPAMAARALTPDHDGPRLHHVSNIDGADLADTVRGLDPSRTLVIVCSKSFGTLETMANARLARAWLGDHGAAHMVGVSANPAACRDFGIPRDRVFGFWDWVGGRYSLWSAVGLSLAIGIGARRFRSLLAGAADMDRHFRTAPLRHNLPVLHALVGIWRRNLMGWPSVALVPYDQRLDRFVAFIQQLEMESNGKRVTRDGEPAGGSTSPVIWGEPGSNAQHSFFQFLHQGTDTVPVDFLIAARPRDADPGHHALLQANCLAQGQALALGRTADEVAAALRAGGEDEDAVSRLVPHLLLPGDRPSTTVTYRSLDPYSLGRLVALYEHRVFVQGVIWGVNSHDQWGVEHGKALADGLIQALRDGGAVETDHSTRALVARLRELGS